MATEFQKQIKKELLESNNIFINNEDIKCKKSGEVEVRRSYFYRHENTAQKWVENITGLLTTPANVKGRDDWAAWPKTSYFVAIISEK